MISQSITESDVLKALEWIGKKGVPNNRKSKKYSLVHKGKKYPPKYVISIANKMATGRELGPDKFNGGKESNDFLEKLGFEIIGGVDKEQKLKDILHLDNYNNYKLHFATGEKSKKEALLELQKGSFKNFQDQQSKRNFERKYILALVYLADGEWLFAGIYESLGYKTHPTDTQFKYRYNTVLTDNYKELVGRLIVKYDKNFRQSYPYLENHIECLVISEILNEPLFNTDALGNKDEVIESKTTLQALKPKKIIVHANSFTDTTLLTYYTTAFQSLNQGNTDYGPAPHKPILLLSIIDQLEQQTIITERVTTDEQLKTQFQKNWKLLVNTGHRCDINNPLYHLQKEGFWRAVKTDGEPLNQARGISKIAYGLLDTALAELLASAEYRAILRMVILDRYFETTQASYLAQNPYPAFITEIAEQVVESPQQRDTHREAWRLVTGYIRNHKFRKALMEAYDYTCCMSRLQTTPDIGIIEACHIRPHALSGNSHISNGIPLCRNLHRAFDSGMIGIDDQYQILLRPKNEFSESVSLYGIRQLVGQGIVLPEEERFYPSLEALGWHRERYGF